jgi:hypothetical protein
MTNTAVGLFQDPETALVAARKIKEAGLTTPELMSPVPMEGVEEVLGKKKSVIKNFTFFGALFGGIFGFAMAAGTAVLYLHPTGGRPIIAIPPFMIITYEMTILFGIIFTVLGFFVSSRLPAIQNRVYVPEAAVDKFVVAVPCEDQEKLKKAQSILSEAGAEQVREVAEEDS